MKFFACLLAAASLCPAATFYVSPEGRAEWSGRLAAPNAERSDGPLPSVSAARDAIRGLRAKGSSEPVTVLIRGGRYFLSEPLVFRPIDSGAPAQPVIYQAYRGEHVVISGGRKIEGWVPGTGKVWTAAAPGHFHQLFVNGRRAQRARTPTQGFFRIDGPSSQEKPFRLKFRGNDIRPEWAGHGVEVVALLAWAEIRMPITAVDPATHTATLAGDPRESNRETDARYWIENTPGALDAPGEWYQEAQSGALQYWPADGDHLETDEVIAPELTQLVRIEGGIEVVHDITFQGLEFRHTDWRLEEKGYADTQAAIEAPSAFEAVRAENIAIEHCTFTQMGGYAVWFNRGSKHNRLTGSEIFDMGAGGVKVGETAMREPEADRNRDNVITDNEIHDLGKVYPAAVGVWVGQSSGNTVSHNHIHDLFYTAISVGWTWGYGPNQCDRNKIEYNHLHHIGNEMLSDLGAIYTLGMQPGTVIRNNLIHDVSAFTYGGWGIYPDEGSTGILIENNIVYRTKSAGFHQHYGRENVVRNNIFAFGREYQVMRTRAEPHLSFRFEQNIVYFNEGRLLGGNWTGDQFHMDRNVYWDSRGAGDLQFSGSSWGQWQARGKDPHSKTHDPLFVNAGSYDFRLRPESPALVLGFRQIDMKQVGPREPAGARGSTKRN